MSARRENDREKANKLGGGRGGTGGRRGTGGKDNNRDRETDRLAGRTDRKTGEDIERQRMWKRKMRGRRDGKRGGGTERGGGGGKDNNDN